jgi:hypothetical protein
LLRAFANSTTMAAAIAGHIALATVAITPPI